MARLGRSRPASAYIIKGAQAGSTVNKSDSDSFQGTDAQSLVASLSNADVAHGTDVTGLVSVPVSDSDVMHGTDTTNTSIQTTAVSGETMHGTDTANPPPATLSNADTLTGTEGSPASIAQKDTDTAHGTEGTPSIAQTSSDAFHGTDSGSLVANVPSSDSMTGTDAAIPANATMSSSDLGNFVDVGLITFVFSPPPFERVFIVAAESRVMLTVDEIRRRIVDTEVRVKFMNSQHPDSTLGSR